MTTSARLLHPKTLARARDDFFDGLPGHFERLRLGRDELERVQTVRLRAVLAHAARRSPFHARRLAGTDLAGFTLAQLESLPPMTKAEMMSCYDDVVTDRRLTLEAANRHLESVGDEPALFLDRYVVLSSGGTSGVRGVFACDLDGSAQHMAAVVRGALSGLAAAIGWPPPGPPPMTIVAAPTCVHATRGLSSLFLHQRLAEVTFAPVTAPFDHIAATVQHAQPLILIGYPTVIARLADAQAEGKLSISPMAVAVTSEQLTGDHIERITDGLGVAPTNSYGTSEGLMGTAPAGSDIFDFASDLAYIEFVDAYDNPVAIGETAHHVLVTNLYNRTQPLIRYRIDDTMTPAAPSQDHGHQRASLEGRNDELLDIAGVTIHPLTIRSVLVADPAVADYQVRLVETGGLELDVVSDGRTVDTAAVEASLGRALANAGAPPIRLAVHVVDALRRDPSTGKARRFITT